MGSSGPTAGKITNVRSGFVTAVEPMREPAAAPSGAAGGGVRGGAGGGARGEEARAPDLGAGWGEQRGSLRKDLRRRDVFFFLLCTLVGIDTVGSVAAEGPQGLTWMVILALAFFLPYGLLVSELGSAFPVQGGPYVWTRLAFGRLAAGLNQ